MDSLPAPIRLATESLYQEILRQAERMANRSVAGSKAQIETDRNALSVAAEQLRAEKAGAHALGEALRSELSELRCTNERLTEHVANLTAHLEIERSEAGQARLAAQLADDERRRTVEATVVEASRVREQWQGNEQHWLKEIEKLQEELKRNRREADQELGSLQKAYQRSVVSSCK